MELITSALNIFAIPLTKLLTFTFYWTFCYSWNTSICKQALLFIYTT